MSRFLLFIGLIGLTFSGLFAQERYTEEQIALQDRFIQANQYKLLAKYDQALEIYESIIEADPVNASVHHDMARVYLAQEEYAKAESTAKKAIKFDPRNVWYKMTLAEIYNLTEQYAKEAQTYKDIYTLQPNIDVARRLALAYAMSGDYSALEEAVDISLGEYGYDMSWIDMVVDPLMDSEQNNAAEKALKKYAINYPTESDIQVRLAEYYHYTGQAKESKKVVSQLLEREPENDQAQKLMALLQSEDQSDDAMLSWVSDERLDLDIKIKKLLPILNDHSAGKNVGVDLSEVATALREDHPNEAKVWSLSGDIAYGDGDLMAAIDYYEKAIELDKSVYPIWHQLMLCQQLTGDIKGLAEWSEKALDYYPNQSGPYYFQAVVYLLQDDVSESEYYISEAEFMGVKDPYLAVGLTELKAQIKAKSEQWSEAIALLNTIPDQAKSAATYELLGDYHYSAGDKSAATENYGKALKKGGDKARLNQKLQSI